jgi:hypothetical protein
VTPGRMFRALVLLALAAGCLMSVVSAPGTVSPALEPAADTSLFRPGNIISDAVFYDSASMSAVQIQSFLNNKGKNCRPATGGPACLKDYAMGTPTRAADAYCKGQYAGSAKETAAQIIAKVAIACRINPRVLLVTLQKEMTLVTKSEPTFKNYTRAMGFGCPDSAAGACDSTYNGLFNQLYTAAKQFQRYAAKPTGYSHIAGIVNDVAYNPSSACGSSPVLIQNQATASLYNYTPYQPNAQALAAGYGASSSSCSSYGNRNFWLWFTDWFGSTQTTGRDVDAPVGRLDSVGVGTSSITLRGWTYDPSAPTTSINVHVYVDGRFFGAVPANRPRPDIGAAYPGVGNQHGFDGTVVAPPGPHAVCIYTVNTGAGYTNPLLGCRSVAVPTYPAHVPVGLGDPVKVSALTATVSGWAVDPDVPTSPLRVHIYVDDRLKAAVTADGVREDVQRAYPRAGAAHGFSWSGALPAGSHRICAFGINLGAGTANPNLGCQTVVLGGPPVGGLEKLTTTPGQVRVAGWSIDPDTVDPISVHVYVNGVYKSAAVANLPRPDIETARPGSGSAHGFDVTVPAAGGDSTVCVYGINVLTGGSNSRLGCGQVTVTATQYVPIGNLDTATGGAGSIATTGWALDKDVPTDPVRVHFYVDGAWKLAVTADRARADISQAFPGAGPYHGWSTTLTGITSGAHTLCAYAINLAGGASSPKLACRAVTVP